MIESKFLCKKGYVVQSFEFDTPKMEKEFTTREMIKFAKSSLKHNKRIGYDRGVTSKDLTDELNAWVYLKNIGLGKRCK